MTIAAFLSAVRRRLRRTWVVATWAWIAPFVAVVALLLVTAAHRVSAAWLEPAAVALAVGAAVVVAITGLVLRIPDAVAARAADRQLNTKDALATALEVDPESAWGERVHRRATTLIAGVEPRASAPIHLPARRVGLTASVALIAVVVALGPNHQEDRRRERAEDRTAIEAVAGDLTEEADAVLDDPEASDAERVAAADLAALAEELREADSLAAALETLEDGRAELSEGVDADLLAQKAAVKGLDRSLEQAPLPGAEGPSAADQLDQAAKELGALDAAGTDKLAQRLEALAEAQASANPAVAAALSDAAAALRVGDAAGATAALGEAAAAQRAAAGKVAVGEARAAAAGAAARAADRLAASASRSGAAASPRAGNGNGDRGAGGTGGGNGGGNPSGNVAGSAGGQGSGRGGAGQSGRGGPEAAGANQSEPTLFDPTGADGEDLEAGGSPNGEPGEVIGQGNGTTNRGSAQVPLSEAVANHEDQATAALERGDLPPSKRDLVRNYFDQLTNG